MGFIFIDGNNLAIRSAFANSELSVNLGNNEDNAHPDDIFDISNEFPTGVLHGFFRSIIFLKKEFPCHYMAIVWDGGNSRRKKMTEPAIKNKMIKNGYKENRITDSPKKEILNYLMQKEVLKEAISLTNIPQIIMKDEEADDVVCSYVHKYKSTNQQIVLYTTDKDYYQLLDENVLIFKDNLLMSSQDFEKTYGIPPNLWVDACAFSGDTSDNIFGVPGWGEKTSIAAISEYGSFGNTYLNLHEKYDHLKKKYPDITSESDFEELSCKKTSSGKLKYPEIVIQMPFTGVALAFERGLIKMPKAALNALIYEYRARLAFELKKMICDLKVPNLPGTFGKKAWNRNKEGDFQSFCLKYSLHEILESSQMICSDQVAI